MPFNVCIAGAGGISESHIKILKSLPNVRVTAVVDPQFDSAKRLASAWGVEHAFSDPSEVISRKLADAVHVLVPPDKHKAAALPYIEAGIHAFLEKPMCLSVADAEELKAAAAKSGALVGVNQNTSFTPAHVKAKAIINSNVLGPVHHVYCYWNNDLGLLSAKKYTQWLFQQPKNIFWEQAVHPLSQIYDLVGPLKNCQVHTLPAKTMAPGIDFISTWQISMECEKATAQFFYSIGQPYPTIGMFIICTNGTIAVDLLRNRVITDTSTPGRDFIEYHTSKALSRQLKQHARTGFVEELKATFGLRHASDWQSVGMRNSIAAFYQGLENRKLKVDVNFGLEVVKMAEMITAGIPDNKPVEPPSHDDNWTPDVAVFGGTGFIGRHIVKRLVDAGMKVNVSSRGTRGLPEIFYHPQVRCFPGSVADPNAVENVIGDAKYVIDLAFSFGDGSWDYMEKVGIGGARNVAEACLRKGVKRLIYTSTIGVLDLSSPRLVVKDSTGPDASYETRDFYSKFKAVSEKVLLDMHREKGLDVCILRPGLVVGEDGNPYHAGVAKFYNKQHATCLSPGEHPLPFVLAGDCADAFYKALTAPGISGKSYNLVGDVRPSGREYIDELSKMLGQPIEYVEIKRWKMKSIAIVRWLLKMTIGRFEEFPNLHEIDCAGLWGRFDNSEIKADLGWKPVADRAQFIRDALDCHREGK